MRKKIGIIGAGVSGLRAAQVLDQAAAELNLEIHLFEADYRVGGRVKTDELHGYLLDHGFQIFLPAYPEVQSALNIPELQLKKFSPGAYIRKKYQYRYIADPLREPLALFSTLASPIGTVRDKLKILQLKSLNQVYEQNESTENFLRKFGFSYHFINEFFRPFFSGIFLERGLNTPSGYFLFLYQIFSRCYASLPAQGMEQIPQQMLNSLKNVTVHLKSPVKNFDKNSIEGESFDFVINSLAKKETSFHSVTTDYFLIDHLSTKPALYLNAGDGIINHIAPVSKVAPLYRGKNGKELLSVNLIGKNYDADLDEVRQELDVWFPHSKVTHLKRYNIENALPDLTQANSELKSEVTRKDSGVYLCGDDVETPSLNGALASGRKVAERILGELKNSKS